MSRKNKQINNREEYWRKKGFDSNREFLIYQYLCGRLRRQSKINKIDKSKQFRTYKSWKEHIEGIVNAYKEDELSEFYHFIILRERACDIDISVSTSLLLPIVVALIGGIVAQNVIYMLISVMEFKANNLLEFIAAIIVLFFVVMVVFFIMVIIFREVLLPYIKSKNETSFWSDC